MKICQLVPGSGGTFYCQNCLRDLALVRALRRQGHDVIMLPLYLPPAGDGADVRQETPIFFGGINVWLQEHFPMFRKTPRWIDRLFDASWMLKQAAAREGSTNAAELGPMTLSMLEGRKGNQKKEFERLVAWLDGHERPDIIHISNALLLGLALEIKRALGVPIVCSLQDEEPWVDTMHDPFSQRCWETMTSNAACVDLFLATSAWYAGRMSARMNIPRERITVILLGVEMDGVVPAKLDFDPPVIGFLSRLSESQGFGVLVDAFIELKQDPALKNLRLRATGGCTDADRPLVKSIRAKLRASGIEESVEFLSDFREPQRREFLRSLSVLSVPAPQGEAAGIELLEAMAHGVPVVQPRVGSYPEIIAATGGGLLYDQEEPGALAAALRSLLCNPEQARALGQRGRAAVAEQFTIDRVARNTVAAYASVLGPGKS